MRRFLIAAACAALLVATAWLLDRFAREQFTAHLRDQAALALALAAQGETPYRWHFDSPDSIIAGRVFDAADFRFENGELVVRSGAAPFDVGLPLTRPIDLALFPQLHIATSADGPASLRVVVYDSMQAQEKVLDSAAAGPGVGAGDIDLAAPNWRAAGLATDAPRVAAVLRLRIVAPPHTTVRLLSAALLRSARAQRLDLARVPQVLEPPVAAPTDRTAVYRLPLGEAPQKVDIAAIGQMYTTPARQPLILLPQRARVEQQIALRNAVYAALPSAILLPEGALDATFLEAREQAGVAAVPRGQQATRWIVFALYASVLVWMRLRPPRALRPRAAVEAGLALIGPLWLILVDGFDGKPDLPQLLLIVAILLYAVSLSIPRDWCWNGSRRAWVRALAIPLAAACIGVLTHDWSEALRPIGSAHVLRYLAWALLQQYLICAVCTERWYQAGGNRFFAAYLGALGFALLHTPNAALMLATLAGGLCWCTLYLRERALLPLAVSHAASALLLLALLPRSILASAEVSARFFQ